MATVEQIENINIPISGKKLRTCAYCRVSSSSADQLNSYTVQVKHYTKYIQSRSDWELVDVFADEGITGTRADKRTEFRRMIRLCEHNRIDQIITKSVSRFARNLPECLEYARSLRRQGIGIVFEENGINTLRMSDEMILSTFAALAQEESMQISIRLKHMNRERMKRGEYVAGTTPYGYRYQEKKLIAYAPEANIVKWIFDSYLNGMSIERIADSLNSRKIPRQNGTDKWWFSTVRYILLNEKYVGDILLQKNFTSDTLPFTAKKNHGELAQYYISDDHESIISREVFLAASSLLAQKSEQYKSTHHSSAYLLTRKLRCSKCGGFYIRRVRKNFIGWGCGSTIRGKTSCKCGLVKEEQIFNAFIRMVNKLRYNSKTLLRSILYQLDFAMTYKAKNSQQAVDLNQQILQFLDKKHMLEQLHEKGYMPDTVYLTQCRNIDKQLNNLQIEKNALFDTQLESTYAEVHRLTSILEGDDYDFTVFHEELFKEIVQDTTITPESAMSFKLIGGLTFTERL